MVVVMVVVKLLLLFVPYPSWHQLLEVNQDNPFGSFFCSRDASAKLGGGEVRVKWQRRELFFFLFENPF